MFSESEKFWAAVDCAVFAFKLGATLQLAIERSCLPVDFLSWLFHGEKRLKDFHPEHQNVIVASPCSGHGFKHSAAIGEVLSQLAQTGKSDIDISKFSLTRFK